MPTSVKRFGLVCLTLTLTPLLHAASPTPVGLDFKDLSDIEVTSISRKEDKLMEAAAAVHVITGEDIRRAGVNNIAEALRLAPGMEVARMDAHTWAISSRGFNSTTANKLLVLVDGRPVYTPLYGGVFWDVQSISLNSIDRIEVIRGPGGAAWGANAMNGVINIIRKPAAETQGGKLAGALGTQRGGVGLRYGGVLGNNGCYRVFSGYVKEQQTRVVGGGDGNDAWHTGMGSFRADWDTSSKNSYSFSTDVYAGEEDQTSTVYALTPPYSRIDQGQTELNGGNVMGFWTHRFSDQSNVKTQLYYDRTKRNIPAILQEIRNTYGVDTQNQFPLGTRQNVIWGIGYRASQNKIDDDGVTIDFDPDAEIFTTYNTFLQDEIRFQHFLFALGSKFEHNSYTAWEIQPNARASWLINEKNTLWTAVSRAVRVPTRFDRDLTFAAVTSTSPLTTTSFRGTDDFDSEKLTAYELGYRTSPSRLVYVSLATFYNVYDDLFSAEPGASFTETNPSPSHTDNPTSFKNLMRGESYGVELTPQVAVTDWWRLQATYTYLHLRLHLKDGSQDTLLVRTESNDPKHQASLRSAMNLPKQFELDGAVRYVDNLKNLKVGSYVVGDVRVSWRGIPRTMMEVGAQNILKSRHREFRPGSAPGNEIKPNYYGRMTWDF